MFVFMLEVTKCLSEIRIANREDPDQTAFDLGLHCLSRPFWKVVNAKDFRTLLYINTAYLQARTGFND